MRATIWKLIFGLGLVVLPAMAAAEVRTTTADVSLRKRPGEKAEVVVKLGVGTEVQILREEGRWLLVRAKGEEGYLTRTTVTLPKTDATPAKATWSANRRVGGQLSVALFVEITAPTAALLAAPQTKSTAVASLAKGTKLTVVDATSKPGWVRATDPAGHDGWVSQGDITDGTTTVTLGTQVRAASTGSNFRRGPTRRLSIRTDVGIGIRSFGMDLTANAAGGLTNYLVDSYAEAASLNVDVVRRLNGRWFVAGDLTMLGTYASPGINYPGPSSASGKIGFRTFSTDLGVRGGFRARREIDVSLRVGGHYDAFLTDKVDNVGMLPRERLVGLTVGARTEILPRTSPFSAAVKLDVMVAGARAQSGGLQDGTSSTAHALWGGITVRYAWSRRWAVIGGYDFGRMTTSWTGKSSRQPGVTETKRTDLSQLLQLGIGADL